MDKHIWMVLFQPHRMWSLAHMHRYSGQKTGKRIYKKYKNMSISRPWCVFLWLTNFQGYQGPLGTSHNVTGNTIICLENELLQEVQSCATWKLQIALWGNDWYTQYKHSAAFCWIENLPGNPERKSDDCHSVHMCLCDSHYFFWLVLLDLLLFFFLHTGMFTRTNEMTHLLNKVVWYLLMPWKEA